MMALGTENPADLMAMYLTRGKADNAIDKMGQVVQEGRANSSLDIQGKVNTLRATKGQSEKAGTSRWEARREGGARASSTEADHWEVGQNQVARIHVQPRSTLFTAEDADASLPQPHRDRPGRVRTTRGKDLSGNQFVLHDYWQAAKHPRRSQPFRWTGTTLSIVVGRW